MDAAFELSRRQSRLVGYTLSVGTLVLVVGTDILLLGDSVALSLPYTLPVVTASWFISRRAGFAFTVITCTIWTAIGSWSGALSDAPRALELTYATRFIALTLIGLTVAALHRYIGLNRDNAVTDTLTGLLNRRGFLQRLEYEIARAERSRQPMTLLFGDLDGFKRINDRHGHAEGDRVLERTAEILMEVFRASDIVGRLGGDEFVVLLPDTEGSHAADLAERAAVALRDGVLASYGAGISFGAAAFTEPPESADKALMAADQLMYEAKREGGSAVAMRELPGPSDDATR